MSAAVMPVPAAVMPCPIAIVPSVVASAPAPAARPLAPGTYIPLFGTPRWATWSLGVGGRFTLEPLTDAEARELVAEDVLLILNASGVHRVRVVGVRTGIAGDSGTQKEVPVVDVRYDDGRRGTNAPCDLFDIALASSEDRS